MNFRAKTQFDIFTYTLNFRANTFLILKLKFSRNFVDTTFSLNTFDFSRQNNLVIFLNFRVKNLVIFLNFTAQKVLQVKMSKFLLLNFAAKI